MPTNRQIYFDLLKENNKYLNRDVIVNLLMFANNFEERTKLYSNFDAEIADFSLLNRLIDEVKKGVPYQYVLGFSYFLGSKIKVNNNVLIPRQETEQLVMDSITFIHEMFKDKNNISIADICTGSGAIANILESKFAGAKIYASDISQEALEVAKENTNNVTLMKGNLIDPFIEKKIQLDVLICNPPYIEKVERIDEQVFKYEPHLALLASPGTKCYEEIFKKSHLIMNEHFLMCFEIEEDMQDSLTNLMNKYLIGCTYIFRKDLYDKTRFLYIIK